MLKMSDSEGESETKTEMYDPSKFNCSELINIDKTLKSFQLLELPIINNKKEVVTNKGNIFNEIVKKGQKELLRVPPDNIDGQLLLCPGDFHRVSSKHIKPYQSEYKTWKLEKIPPNENLEVLKHSFELKDLPEFRCTYLRRFLKYRTHITTGVNVENLEETNLVTSNGDCIITIHVFDPFLHPSAAGASKRPAPKFSHEIHVLGSNYIKDFRDCIRCVQDRDTGKDISDDPGEDTTPAPGGPCVMYVQGTIYYDERFSDNEYAEILKQWADGKKIFIKSAPMADVKFTDLTVRLGYPQMYQHRGTCEHLIVFSNIEYVKPGRSLNVDSFPVLTKLGKKQYPYCKLCEGSFATWILMDNSRTPYRELLWCTSCMLRYNYIGDVESRMGEFKCYRYNV